MSRSAPATPAEVEQATGAVAALGVRAFGTALDIADAAALRSWVDEAAAALGGIDIVVANVSALSVGPGEESWRAGFEVDMMGCVRLVEAAMPSLEASKAASIVSISSVSGREVDFAAGPYGAFKAALIHYTQGLAFQLAGRGSGPIRCRPAIPISRAASGTASRTATRTSTRPRWT